jgi:hypothetical protein
MLRKSEKDYFAGMASEIRFHNSTGGAAQRWAVSNQQKRGLFENLVTGGPLDAPVAMDVAAPQTMGQATS